MPVLIYYIFAIQVIFKLLVQVLVASTYKRYLQEQWSMHVHPKGQIYFSRSIALCVVKDLYIYTPVLGFKHQKMRC